MPEYNIIFPNQLFENIPFENKQANYVIIKEYLFYQQFKFHQLKLDFHNYTIDNYYDYLKNESLNVKIIESNNPKSDIRLFIDSLNEGDLINIIDPVDDWLNKRIHHHSEKNKIKLNIIDNPSFLNSRETNEDYFFRNKFYQTNFYIEQRKKLNILISHDGSPVGGKWTFDTDNRKKYPKNKFPPKIKTFKNIYPSNFKDAKEAFEDFLSHRFYDFGIYEDAIVSNEHFLNHSILSPLLNSGLLTPDFVITRSIEYAKDNDIPINSLEGFIRQIIGWREFIKAVYELKGTEERTKNFWGFERKIPNSFYDGSTGIEPLDDAIKKVNKTAYNHHIERLMIIGNFMLLCEFDPNEVYKWFMELYIDAYDWVMVPNVYGMSQFADGGIFATKPYISGSNYIIKMSDYKKGKWSEIWDALFWRFMHVHRDYLKNNHRLSMLISTFDKRDGDKKNELLNKAELFLSKLEI